VIGQTSQEKRHVEQAWKRIKETAPVVRLSGKV